MKRALIKERQECKRLWREANYERLRAITMDANAAERLGLIE